MITLSLIHKYFEFIKSGKKTIEGRINTPKFANIKKEDLITFISNQTKVRANPATQQIIQHQMKDNRYRNGANGAFEELRKWRCKSRGDGQRR